jgi:epoxyqueuosine reductase
MDTMKFNPSSSLLSQLGIIDYAIVDDPKPLTYHYFMQWLQADSHGMLTYLGDYRSEVRSSLLNYFPTFKSGLVFLFDYRNQALNNSSKKIANYALAFNGYDYHYVLKARLEDLMQEFQLIDHQICIDTAPILERDLAYRAGLGWFGKNSMLINPDYGSNFLIASVFFPYHVSSDIPERPLMVDHCGQCRKCIDACPTQAITENRTLEANRCIATYTIEAFKPDIIPIPSGLNQTDYIFGCDICQQVCPWNERQVRKNIQGVDVITDQSMYELISVFFLTRDVNEILSDLNAMSNREYTRKFKHTALERTGRVGMIKNLQALIKE